LTPPNVSSEAGPTLWGTPSMAKVAAVSAPPGLGVYSTRMSKRWPGTKRAPVPGVMRIVGLAEAAEAARVAATVIETSNGMKRSRINLFPLLRVGAAGGQADPGH